MRISVFSAHKYERDHLERARKIAGLAASFDYYEVSLTSKTVSLAETASAVCVFVNDILDDSILEKLNLYGCKAILLRCAGYNNVDMVSAKKLGFFVANVPSYSPESVAEYAVGLIQTLNRKIFLAHDRVRMGNFLLDGLLGICLKGKTVGIVGTGRIGMCFARIMNGFGCRLLAYDPYQNNDFLRYGTYTNLDNLLAESDIISLHCPLFEGTTHIINKNTLHKMKTGAILVNVSRGGLVDTEATINSLKEKHLGGFAADVYEREGLVFYLDHSTDIIADDALMLLTTFPNVIITGHQAFFTEEALAEITKTTVDNAICFFQKSNCANNLVVQNAIPPQDAKPAPTKFDPK
ncbi:hypothetical protein H072_5145 [Dactylellina haptotyla CBS 200.50]|uniref:S-adenosyl-L-homocysteine hydrolase NAD binding domain-containing protein n=1 Tax=Dactylellina haptotyla (strain CBS 200.50) TaxID=1284197 RepID=S8ADA2_DACHA|nr:hypothetical protein H072_5145 [Dactylellina haptotyla CBS 200.50]